MKILILCIYISLIAIRAPQLLYDARFWAEEGAIYFNNALTQNHLYFLFTPELGYYSLVNKLASLFALLVPLKFAPLVTTLVALLVQVLPVWVLLYSKVSKQKSYFPILAI